MNAHANNKHTTECHYKLDCQDICTVAIMLLVNFNILVTGQNMKSAQNKAGKILRQLQALLKV